MREEDYGIMCSPSSSEGASDPQGLTPLEQERPCTCHPDDNPPSPCAERYALSDCRAEAGR